MTTAVTGAMTSYFTACAREALFTRPFRIGYALRLADGTHAAPRAARLLLPSTAAPLMIVREPRMSGNTLQTLTEIVNNPMKLTVSLDPFTLPAASPRASPTSTSTPRGNATCLRATSRSPPSDRRNISARM